MTHRPITGGYRIRQASHADTDALAQMKLQAWRESYAGLLPAHVFDELAERAPRTAAHWRAEMDRGIYFWAVVAPDGRFVGVSNASPTRDEDSPTPLELTMIYLLDEAKGSGIADRLLETTIGDAPASLWVLADNPRARAFYTRHGFATDGMERVVEPSWGDVREVRMVRR